MFKKTVCVLVLLCVTGGYYAQNISTIAGTGTAGFSGDGGAATAAKINTPTGVCVNQSGDVYISDYSNNRVRKIAVGTGIITTVVGTGVAGYSGDGGLATLAKINGPEVVALDAVGNLYIAEDGNNVIRKVTVSTGIISTVAGTGVAGFSGDGGAATLAKLNKPEGLGVSFYTYDIYIADQGNNRIRRVDRATGKISTVAGTGVAGYSGDGAAATLAKLNQPAAVDLDQSENVYIADYLNNRIRMIDAVTQNISTVAGNGTAGYSGDGAAATLAKINNPYGVSIDPNYNILIADYLSNAVRVVNPSTGFISTIAGTGVAGYSGDGGPATAAKVNQPLQAVYQLSTSNVYISDYSNNRIRNIPGVVLPIELLNFSATLGKENEVDLKWSTASETNNNFFEVEQSSTGKDFKKVGTVKGAGNSSSVLHYNMLDPNPTQGTSYYRLKQVDFNGNYTYFAPVAVNLKNDDDFTVFPNPSTRDLPTFMRYKSSDAGEEILVVLLDETGREVYSKVEIIDQTGENLIAVDGMSKLHPGLYFISASSSQAIYRRKLIIR